MRESDQPRPGTWRWLGRIPYAAALKIQIAHRERVIRNSAKECLYLLEHPPVITLGRSADPANILADFQELGRDSIDVIRTNRGGDVTVHGPGQLVGYPIFRLTRGLRVHMETLAMAVGDVLLSYGIKCEWRGDRPGLWIGDGKLCAFGIHVRSRVTMHGFALNVRSMRPLFAHIIPCGLKGTEVGSMEDCLGREVPVIEIAERMPEAFTRRFGIDLVRDADSSLQLEEEIVPR